MAFSEAKESVTLPGVFSKIFLNRNASRNRRMENRDDLDERVPLPAMWVRWVLASFTVEGLLAENERKSHAHKPPRDGANPRAIISAVNV